MAIRGGKYNGSRHRWHLHRYTKLMPVLLWMTFVGSALVILAFGIPMAMRKVPPNAIYGVRLPITMRNRAAWDAANVQFGWWMTISGMLALGAFFLGWLLGWTVDAIATVYCIVMLLPLMVGVVTSIMAAYGAESDSVESSKRSKDDIAS